MLFQTSTDDELIALDEIAEQTTGFVGEIEEKLISAWQTVEANGPEWAIGIGIVALLYLFFRLLRAVIAGMLKTKKHPANSLRNVLASLVSGTSSLVIIVGAAVLVAPFVFNLSDDNLAFLRTSFTVLVIIQIALWARVLAKAFLTRAAERSTSDDSTIKNAMSVLTILVNVVIFLIAGMTILQNMNVDVTALVAGLGVGGIAIALAAQNIFQDLFASLSIIFDKPFAKGDFIQYGSDGTRMGTVEKIGLKTTRIKSLSGEQLVIGNSQLLAAEVRNYRRMTERRIVFQIGVTYQTPHDQLEKIPGYLKGIIENTDNVRFDRAHLLSFADSAISFEIVYFVLTREMMDYMNVNQKILLSIHEKFQHEGIDFAYPTRTLWIEGGGDQPTAMESEAPTSALADRRTGLMKRK